MELESPQIAEHRDMPLQGETFIVGKGPAVPAGDTIALTFTGLPHQPVWPRNVALALALADSGRRRLGQHAHGAPADRQSSAAGVSRRSAIGSSRARVASRSSTASQHDRLPTATRRAGASWWPRSNSVYAELDDEAAA